MNSKCWLQALTHHIPDDRQTWRSWRHPRRLLRQFSQNEQSNDARCDCILHAPIAQQVQHLLNAHTFKVYFLHQAILTFLSFQALKFVKHCMISLRSWYSLIKTALITSTSPKGAKADLDKVPWTFCPFFYKKLYLLACPFYIHVGTPSDLVRPWIMCVKQYHSIANVSIEHIIVRSRPRARPSNGLRLLHCSA